MQQVLNIQDRTQAFLKFLIFFVITTLIVIGAIFYNYRLPSKENARLKQEVETNRLQESNQEKFLTEMQLAVILLDSIKADIPNVEQISSQFKTKADLLDKLKDGSGPTYTKINSVTLQKLMELYDAKRSGIDLRKKVKDLEVAAAEGLRYKDEADRLRNTQFTN
ncbi:MAG: hypothetical protein H7Y27_09780 [Gemmatimonadaceae bacterium]|nr:hypothetical protein [Chitinophagaceae bacterium]